MNRQGIFVAFLSVVLIAGFAAAQAPNVIDFQGKVNYLNGTPYTGSPSMTFRIYNVFTGGSQLWSETQTVSVQNGYFDAILGGLVNLSTVSFNQALYLELTVAGDTLSPRLNFTQAPIAYNLGGLVSVNGTYVGINTAAPNAQLHLVSSSSSGTHFKIQDTAGRDWDIVSAGPGNTGGAGGLHFFEVTAEPSTGTTRLYIQNGTGRVGIGTTSPGNNLDVVGGITASSTVSAGGFSTGGGVSANTVSGSSYGAFGTGCCSKTTSLALNGGSRGFNFWQANGDLGIDDGFRGATVFYVSLNGNVGIGQSGANNYNGAYVFTVQGASVGSSWQTTSDARLKKNIALLGPVLENVTRLRAVSYDWNDNYYRMLNTSKIEGRQIGFIAQDVKQVFPEVVGGGSGNDSYLAIDYARLTVVLAEAVKELKAENDALRVRVSALEMKVG